MRYRLPFLFISILSLLATAAAAQAVFDVPIGKAVAIDGKIEAQEWSDAARHEMTNGGVLLSKTDGSHIYVAMRGQKEGWSHVYLSRGTGSDVSVIHASAALERIVYKQDEKKLWQPANEFVWEVRQRVVNDETTSVMNSYLAKNGWVASNNNMGNGDEVEYKLAVEGRDLRLAAVFISAGGPPAYFPSSLADDSLQQKLLEGNAVRDLKFEVTQWARIRLRSKS